MSKDKKAPAEAPAPAAAAAAAPAHDKGHGGGHDKKKPAAPVATAAAKTGCKFEACNKKDDKFGFCMEHYEMYMAGVIRGDGRKPIDYEQKLSQFFKSNTARKAA